MRNKYESESPLYYEKPELEKAIKALEQSSKKLEKELKQKYSSFTYIHDALGATPKANQTANQEKAPVAMERTKKSFNPRSKPNEDNKAPEVEVDESTNFKI